MFGWRARRVALCFAVLALVALVVTACATRPEGEAAERQAAERAGAPFAAPHGERSLPELAEDARLVDVHHYAFQSNARIEAAFFEWRAALERVPQAVALDDPRLSRQFMLSPSKMTRWDRTTLGVGQMLPFPGKRELAGEVASETAVAAGRRFEDAKFTLQADVVQACAELWLVDETVGIGEANLALLQQAPETARQLVAVGRATQAEATKADLEVEVAENELQSRRAERPPALARLNALLSRPPVTALRPVIPTAPPTLPADDRVLALVAERNPGLQEFAAAVLGQRNALELAGKAWLPDFELSLFWTGSIERVLLGVINLPLEVGRTRGDDLGASTVLHLFLARDGERPRRHGSAPPPGRPRPEPAAGGGASTAVAHPAGAVPEFAGRPAGGCGCTSQGRSRRQFAAQRVGARASRHERAPRCSPCANRRLRRAFRW